MAKSSNKTTENAGSAGVKSVEIGLGILDAISGAETELTLTEIADATGHSPPRVHRYLTSLLRSGVVERVEESGRYALGPDAVALGFAALSGIRGREAALEVLGELNREIDKSVVLFIWGDGGPVVVGWQASSDPITFSARLGLVLSPLQSISGRLFLAYMPKSVCQKILKREFGKTPKVLWDGERIGRKEFEERLAEIRKRGLFRGQNEMIFGIDTIGAPVLNDDGEVDYVIVAVGATGSIDISWRGSTARALQKSSKTLSALLAEHTKA